MAKQDIELTGRVGQTSYNVELIPITHKAAETQALKGTAGQIDRGTRFDSVEPNHASVGDTIKLKGHGFGARGIGYVTLNGTKIDVVAWGTTEIHCVVPPGARSGDLLVWQI